MTSAARRGFRLPLGLAAAAVCATAWATAGPARADEESPALAKYNPQIEKAVSKALEYLASKQASDGSFQSYLRPEDGRASSRRRALGNDTAVTSLCVMAFLAKGHTPGVGPYGQIIDKGIDFTLGQQQDSGLLVAQGGVHGAMYNHGISTLMLSEVSGMVTPERQKRLDQGLAKALRLILTAQACPKSGAHQGGWRYQATSSDSDISCTGWCLMALRSARNNGAPVPLEAVEKGIRFVMNCRGPGGAFCYQPSGAPGLARTGTALLCLELCGRHRDAACQAAGKYILQNLPRRYGEQHFYYGLYYTAQGMFQLGGDEWERFAVHMYEMMLKFQKPDGSWPQGSSSEAAVGTCYSTAMSALAMTVSYRQLPIYQR